MKWPASNDTITRVGGCLQASARRIAAYASIGSPPPTARFVVRTGSIAGAISTAARELPTTSTEPRSQLASIRSFASQAGYSTSRNASGIVATQIQVSAKASAPAAPNATR